MSFTNGITRRRVYLAGPMRGLASWNAPAFDLAEGAWTTAGWHAFSPAAIVRAMGYAWGDSAPAEPDGGGPGSAHLKHVLVSDIACLIHSDAIALLPGWERSRGATVELAVAQFLGLEVYDAVTMERIYPPVAPWANTVPLGGDVPLEDGWQDAWRGMIASTEARFNERNRV